VREEVEEAEEIEEVEESDNERGATCYEMLFPSPPLPLQFPLLPFSCCFLSPAALALCQPNLAS
jgi:hypothetical protein